MPTLTEYRRPTPRYGREALERSPWISPGGWHERDDGAWCRVYRKRGRRVRSARRAVVCRVRGWWKWHVEQFDLTTRRVRSICARGTQGYLYAQCAFGFADLAARTAD